MRSEISERNCDSGVKRIADLGRNQRGDIGAQGKTHNSNSKQTKFQVRGSGLRYFIRIDDCMKCMIIECMFLVYFSLIFEFLENFQKPPSHQATHVKLGVFSWFCEDSPGGEALYR